MNVEKSCGAVVFTRMSGSVKYVIIQSNVGVYGFPKGHIELGETEKETALREIAEETSLSVDLLDGFRCEDNYTFMRVNKLVTKCVVYFLAEYNNQTPKAQASELNSICITDYETALTLLKFESSKRILTKAHNFLMNDSSSSRRI